MKIANGYPIPRDTTKGFGSYVPWNEPEQQQYFAMDVLRVVQGLLAGGMQGGTLVRQSHHLRRGALLDAAMEVLERQGFPAWKEREAHLAQFRANSAAVRKWRHSQNVKTRAEKGA